IAQVLQEMGKSLEDLNPELLAEIKELIKLQRELTRVEDAASLLVDTMRTLQDVSTDLDTDIRILRGDTGGYSAETLRLAASLGLVGDMSEETRQKLEELDKKFKELEGLEEFQEAIDGIRGVFENTFENILSDMRQNKFDLVNIFTSLVDGIIDEILRLAIIQPILDAIFGNEKTGSLGSLGKILGSGKKEDKKSAQPVKVLGVTDVKVLEKINVEGLEEGTDKLLQQGDVSNNLLIKLASIMAALGGGGGGGSGFVVPDTGLSVSPRTSSRLGLFGGGCGAL
ncbi:hypothetical protein LCGC14_3077700, partial [marine sediment metagenome]